MVLSEAEAEAQLAALRRQREALDRAITDLTLYLELGRRLTGAAPAPIGEPSATAPRASPVSWPSPEPAERISDRDVAPPAAWAAPSSVRPDPGAPPPGTAARPVAPEPRVREPAQPDPGAREGALSEGVLARRYGRALIEAALAALEEAGRPLHAGEILAVLDSRGFSVPGHDPIAALNTRLWKRSGPGGPLKRMGDAVYALADVRDDARPSLRDAD